MNTLLFLLGLSCGVIGISIGTVTLVLGQVNVTELDTLDRMRYTAIQMTILSLEAQQPTNMSNDQIAEKIYEFQQNNESDRLTTVQIESLYRNITNGSQVE
ncbi:MAG: hypothetical protein ACRD8Z_15850, partial [Nitrososphaeraceae archaeon]